MKQVIIFALVAAALAGGFFMFTARQKNMALNNARLGEQSGDLQQAATLYGALVVERIPTLRIPDVNASKYLAPDLLKKDITAYFAWLSTPSPKTVPDVSAALAGIARCGIHGRKDNLLIDTILRPLTTDQFSNEWNTTFFASNVKIDPSHAVLSSGNYIRNYSLLIIKSGQSYTYDICLVNPSTNRATSTILLPENSIRMYAAPGTYLLLCRSSVTFSEREIWYSHYTPIQITMPEEPSLVIHQIRTSVPRKK